MVRPRKRRMVNFEHDIRHFKPSDSRIESMDEINITIDELESLRLSYLEKMKQDDAAQKMEVHQSTFQRTLRRTLEKISDALVNGKSIRVEGGNYTMPGKDGTGPRGQGSVGGQGRGQRGQGQQRGQRGNRNGNVPVSVTPAGQCKCPGCGYEQAHQPGTPCAQNNCPECGKAMIRK
ncbi:DUF134 domain-containing protein [Methanolobus sp. ZRKC5]|uniref:DUF134 domain-containing protein n=1 Tax=unclassified Methanolobus TaxID=2629569 RepID=UPI00313E72F2